MSRRPAPPPLPPDGVMPPAATGLHPALQTLSYSRLESFEKCPRAFWHGYVARTPPDGYERIESWAGSLVHQVLEEALKQTFQKQVPDPVEILGRFDELWKTGIGPHILITKDNKSQTEYYQTARRALKDYVDAAWPFLDATPLHVEEPVEFPITLPDGTPTRFTGILDRVDRLSDGRLRLIDYKTGNWVPRFDTDRDAFQLALYWQGLLEKYPQTAGGVLVWHYLQHKHAKRIEPEPTLIAAARSWVAATAADIQRRLETGQGSADAFPPKTSILCKWCQFGYACEKNPYRKDAPPPRTP